MTWKKTGIRPSFPIQDMDSKSSQTEAVLGEYV